VIIVLTVHYRKINNYPMKNLFLIISLFFVLNVCFSQTYKYEPYKKDILPTKNLIVMIPDGTSVSVLSAARWFKLYNNMGDSLFIDPYLCGMVKTHSSNAPIGDSAPTASCYMTGMLQQSGNISIYPVADPANDFVEIDPKMAYQPLATLLEAAKILQNKATGLIVTCEFPNATPAACAAHYYDRRDYKSISMQMVYQNLDVLFGGGNILMSDDMKLHLENQNITYIKDDINSFRNLKNEKVYALFGDLAMPYNLDRNDDLMPSLEEMTKKALEILSQNENGFFLMVEGSQIDWAAHINDAIGCITEYIAFDNAVGVALEFAKKDKNTTVIIIPDHGTGGFSVGRYDLKSYDKASLEKLFGQVSKYKKTSQSLEKILLNEKPENIRQVIKIHTDIDITDEEYKQLLYSKNYIVENHVKSDTSPIMQEILIQIMNKRTWFGFTSGGHIGEDVFLAAYHPLGDIPTGLNTNIEINYYLSDVLGLKTKLPELTSKIFVKHNELFAGYETTINRSGEFPVLIVKNKLKTLEIPAYKSVAYLNGQPFNIGSVTVYIDKTNTFYLSEKLSELIAD